MFEEGQFDCLKQNRVHLLQHFTAAMLSKGTSHYRMPEMVGNALGCIYQSSY